jgi:hypothetical protein
MFHKNLTGADLHAPSNYLVENDTGVDIPVLTVVTFTGIGTDFGFPSIAPISSAGQTIRGITMTDVPITANSNAGYITSLGLMINVNTSAWAEGTKLYSDNASGLSTTPLGPLVATVLLQNAATGVLFIEGPASSGGGGGGDVVGPPSSTDKAIAVWDGVTGQLLEDGPGTQVQPSGAIVAQAFITSQDIIGLVTVGADQCWIAPSLNLTDTGSIDLTGGGQLIIVD